ncbi:hypothetical protein AB0F88_15235 [Streptosporangium sp. NPDC023963]
MSVHDLAQIAQLAMIADPSRLTVPIHDRAGTPSCRAVGPEETP